MASAAAASKFADKEWPFSNPWPWMITGLAALAATALWALIFKEALTPLRVGLVFAGTLAAAGAVIIRPDSAVVLACAALAAFLGAMGLLVRENPEHWDSIRMVLAVAAVIALLAAGLVALPRMWRRIGVSVLIVLHFLAILSAVMSASPGPKAMGALYIYVFRNYLEFFYLTNAYHFYAPEPGPAYGLWFRIEYTKPEDGNVYWHWHKVPDLEPDGTPRYPLALQYQRRLALGMLLTQTTEAIPDDGGLIARRHERENLKRYKNNLDPIIPRYPYAQQAQVLYGKPTKPHRRVLSSFARHVARNFQEEHPDVSIKGIKIYRLIHYFPSALDMAKGIDPQDWTYYHPYFWGEYDAQGNRITPDNDPFLYWQLPFLRVSSERSAHFRPNRERIEEIDFAQRARMLLPEEDQFSIDVKEAVAPFLRRDIDVREAFRHSKVLGYMFLHAGDANWVLHHGAKEWTPE
jgi:hypothetical protein